ncbi:lysine N(6)-hydroxylase/L-ornithine N(5)-oxygenase family protein [Saccharopolyspora sp. NPDC000359]|uniref:lysine N(6)-hydroxylase/L-ornithine N(5)-oxygenase family protein n=1 Tax=Saccharopolyspora sp. NPDC000359 TaxID=3154251 RepID=UPI0033177333
MRGDNVTAAPTEEEVHDVLGIGFGPSNLALAIALEEHNRAAPADDRISGVFFERKPAFGWHRGMLIEGTTMQVSFLKDLVTLRNPASDYSFLSYLHAKQRLVDFVNHKTMFPTRVEYHDYLEWAAERVADQVRYDAEVVELHRAGEHFEVVVRRGGQLEVHRARNVVLAVGLEASVPAGAELGDRVWHNLDLLHRVDELTEAPRRCVVVGAGQSAAEVTEYLHRTFPAAEVCAVFSRYGYSPADDSPFANRIFDPQAVEDFHTASPEVRDQLLDYHRNTNYSVVDLDLIEELYARAYQEKVRGEQRLRILNASRVRDVAPRDGGVAVTVEFLPSGERTELAADLLVYATGCQPRDPAPLLGEAAEDCERDERGRLQVERDYRLRTRTDLPGGIYLQGGTEHTHGLTSSLLSNGAVRAGEIRDSILTRRNRSTTPEPNRAVTYA